jgi:hypothetical protein
MAVDVRHAVFLAEDYSSGVHFSGVEKNPNLLIDITLAVAYY